MTDKNSLHQNNEPKLSLKQKIWLMEYLKTGNATRSALIAYDTDDYFSAGAIGSENLKKLKNPIKEYLEFNGMSLGNLIKTLKEGLKANKIITTPAEPDQVIPDFAVRHKYLETAGKWLGIEREQISIISQTNIDIDKPIPILGGMSTNNKYSDVVEFVNFKEDADDKENEKSDLSK